MHDTVAQKNFDPVLPPLPDDLEDELEEESVKIVRLVKNKEPLVSRAGGARHEGEGVEVGGDGFCTLPVVTFLTLLASGRHHQAGRCHRCGDSGPDNERRCSRPER